MDKSEDCTVNCKQIVNKAFLNEFNEKHSAPSFNDHRKMGISSSEYRDVWRTTMTLLKKAEGVCTCLATLRILSRDKQSVCEVLVEDDLKLLLRLSGLEQQQEEGSDHTTNFTDQQLKESHEVSTASCQCLGNLIYQSSAAQEACCRLPYLLQALQRLRQHPALPHALTVALLRLLFLVTAFNEDIRREAVLEHDALHVLLPVLAAELPSVATDAAANRAQPTMQRESVERVVEALKVLYTLCVGLTAPAEGGGVHVTLVPDSSLRPEDDRALVTLVGRVRELLLATAHTHQHTQLMHSHSIDLLVCMPTPALAALTPTPTTSWWGATGQRRVYHDRDMTALVQILAFLHARLNAPGEQTAAKLTPVLTMLLTVCQSSKDVRQFVRHRVMPPLRDVTHRPEEGSSLKSRLVTLMTSPVLQLKHLSATLLFVLCNQSVERLIKYSGYGNCAGLLASLGLLAGGRQEEEEEEDSDTEEYEKVKHMVNPVTGCYEPVRPDPLSDMSEEQREYEAMKLVNALDKLIRSGEIKPCSVGPDGRPQPLEHVLQLQDCPTLPGGAVPDCGQEGEDGH